MAKTTELVAVGELAEIRTGITLMVSNLKEMCEKSISNTSGLTAVPIEDKGIFWDSEHEVTGKELNKLITQIQAALAQNGGQRKLLWQRLIDVYTTINSLDADYLSKIEKLFEQINENYERIKLNNKEICRDQKELECHRSRIDKLIQGHETSLKVLKQFKARIDKLSHLEKVDKLLGEIDIEESFKQIDANHQKVLLVLDEHLGSINGLLEEMKTQAGHWAKLSETLKEQGMTLQELSQFKMAVSEVLSKVDLEKTLKKTDEDIDAISKESIEQSRAIAAIKDEARLFEKRMKCWLISLSAFVMAILTMAVVVAVR